MASNRPIIAGNGLAIALTILFVLPITGVLAYIITTPLDSAMVQFGTWLHQTNSWSFSLFDTQERFAKVGFALRSIVIAVGLSFLYFWLTNWLNQGLARVSSEDPVAASSLLSRRYNRGSLSALHWFCYYSFCLYQRFPP